MDIDDYLPGVSEGYGARVAIHDQKTYPFPNENGMFVSAGTESQISLRMVKSNCLGKIGSLSKRYLKK